jgi:ATP/maltotriose-dependent transcriptional regulator MalT
MAATFGNVQLAQAQSAEALALARRIDQPNAKILALYMVGYAYWRDQPQDALTALDEHVTLAYSTGQEPLIARTCALIAHIRANQGDLAGALDALRDAITSAHRNGDRPAMATAIARGAHVIHAAGDATTAAVFVASTTDGVLGGLNALPPQDLPDQQALVNRLEVELGADDYPAAQGQGQTISYEELIDHALRALSTLMPSA